MKMIYDNDRVIWDLSCVVILGVCVGVVCYFKVDLVWVCVGVVLGLVFVFMIMLLVYIVVVVLLFWRL